MTTRLDVIGAMAAAGALNQPYAVAGVALLIVGLAFKAAIVPFHSWTPDVYEGAPTSVTAFMSVTAKAGAFAAFIRVAIAIMPVGAAPHTSAAFHTTLYVLAILTMIVGNVLAVQQSNIKRMLAYSSIAHAGYILVGLLAQNADGRAGVIFYILAYSFMNLGAFGILILLARRGDEITTIDDLRGLGRRAPVPAALMTVFMLSLGGIPPTAGFMGKYFLFLAAVKAGMPGLAVIGLLASVVGVFYYLRVILSMYFQAPVREFQALPAASSAAFAVAVCAVFSLVLGIYPGPMYDASMRGAVTAIPVVLGHPPTGGRHRG
jgi:NADH-quinone oxidoreductase subunit N